jgi:beta-galactosidase
MMSEFKNILDRDGSVNFYMFSGGTNFGFYNGANYNDRFLPTQTSYDYDALIGEDGVPTQKFYKVREEIIKRNHKNLPELPVIPPRKNYGKVTMEKYAKLIDNLENIGKKYESATPLPMEELGQDYGFILYKTKISGPREKSNLIIDELHDRAMIFLDGKYVKTLERFGDMELEIEIPKSGGELSILVENMGRINYGPKLGEYKGITNGVRLERQYLYNWEMWTLPLKDLKNINYKKL